MRWVAGVLALGSGFSATVSLTVSVSAATSSVLAPEVAFSSAEIVCVIDTTAKSMFVDLQRCKGMNDLRIDVNSIPGWTVDYTKEATVLSEHPHSVELILKAYSSEGYLPKIVVRTLAADSVNIDTKDMRHTLYKERVKE